MKFIMKKMKFLIIALVAILGINFTTVTASNNNPFQPSNVSINAVAGKKSFELSLNDLNTQQSTTISIEDATTGTVLFKENVTGKSNYTRRYHLDVLSNGAYNVVIADAQTVTVQTIELTNDAITIKMTDRKVAFAPSVSVSGNKVALFLMQTDNIATITIENESNEVLYKGTFTNVTSLNKIFDLTKVGAGTYTMRIETPVAKFNETIVIK
jgi:Domain of unknown function (DUF3244)